MFQIYKTPYSFESLFFMLKFDIQYFVWLLIFHRFSRAKLVVGFHMALFWKGALLLIGMYLTDFVLLFTYWDLKCAHILAKFGHHTAISKPSQYRVTGNLWSGANRQARIIFAFWAEEKIKKTQSAMEWVCLQLSWLQSKGEARKWLLNDFDQQLYLYFRPKQVISQSKDNMNNYFVPNFSQKLF